MSKEEIDKLIENNANIIISKNGEIDILQKDILTLHKERKELEDTRKGIIFEMILDYINIDQVIKIEHGYAGGLNFEDVVKIVRKNKKSVTIKFLEVKYSWNQKKVGKQKRIPAKIFGESIYNSTDFKKMIDRDIKLKNLLR
jgi:lipoate synthase